MATARALTLLLLLTPACERAPPARGSADSASPPEASGALGEDGYACLRVGASLANLGAPCRILSDRIIAGPEGMPERRAHVRVGGDTFAVTVVRDSVWRIEVTSESPATEDGIRVGSTAGSLLARPGSRVIGGEGRLFVTLAGHCGMSFELGALPPDVRALPADALRERIPSGARISRVMVFGCEGRR